MTVPVQANPFGVSNQPYWGATVAPGAGHQEVWYLKMNDAAAGRALWLRFTLLIRQDGAKRIAETWAIDFQKTPSGETRKTAAKSTYPIDAFAQDGAGFHIGPCSFTDHHTAGEIQNAGHHLRWGFALAPAQEAAFDFVPAALRRWGLVKNIAVNVLDDLRFTGWSEVDGVRHEWAAAPGMQGHLAGPKNGHSWAWAHCNQFLDEAGQPANAVFDGLSARARLGNNSASPHLTTLYLLMDGEHFCFNTLTSLFRARSQYSPESWQLSANSGALKLRATVSARLGDFAGVTYEDTDGSALYCHNSKVSDMRLEITRAGQPRRVFHAEGTVAYEFVRRDAHPQVPLLL